MQKAIKNLCRVCLGDENLSSIFTQHEGLRICDKVMLCASVQIEENDILPDQICSKCIDRVELAHSFKITCEATDAKLHTVTPEICKQDIFIKPEQDIVVKPDQDCIIKPEHFDKIPPVAAELLIITPDICEQDIVTEPEQDTVIELEHSDKNLPHIAEQLITPDICERDNVTEPEQDIDIKLDHTDKNPSVDGELLITTHDICEGDIVTEPDYSDNIPPVVHEEEEAVLFIHGSIDDCIQEVVICETNFENVDEVDIVIPNDEVKKPSVGRHITKKNGQHPRKLRQKEEVVPSDETPMPIYEEPAATQNTHLNKHTCTFCRKSFPFRSHLTRHLNLHTDSKKYTCKYCKDTFRNSYNLSVHLKKHVGGFPLKCKVCDKGFVSPSVLKRHMISHTKQLPFECEHCTKKFAHKSSLHTHEEMHMTTSTYSCHICYKVFSYKKSLSEHMRRHFGIRNFKCQDCGHAFTRNALLLRHSKSCMQKLKCKFCNMQFKDKDNLINHLKTTC